MDLLLFCSCVYICGWEVGLDPFMWGSVLIPVHEWLCCFLSCDLAGSVYLNTCNLSFFIFLLKKIKAVFRLHPKADAGIFFLSFLFFFFPFFFICSEFCHTLK